MKKEITTASTDDVEDLTHLLNELFSFEKEFTPDYSKQKSGLEQIIANPPAGEILVMKIDGKIIGMISLLYSVSTVLGGKVAMLEDFVIDNDFRRKGLGKELLHEAIAFARQRNCLRLTLLTDFDNEVAINLYKSAGFSLSKMIPLRRWL